MKNILLLFLLLPFTTGCMGTYCAINAGKSIERVSSFDNIRERENEIIVEYTIDTMQKFPSKILSSEKRIQLLIPEKNTSKPLTKFPEWFHTAAAVPEKSAKIKGSHNLDSKFSYLNRYTCILIFYIPAEGSEEKCFTFDPKTITSRAVWGYPVALITLPIGIVFDLTTWPIQIYFVLKGFSNLT